MSKAKDQNGQVQIDSNATKEKSDEGGKKLNASRRKFLKLGLAGAGAAAIAAGGLTAIKRMEGIVHDEFPLPVRDDFKRIDQRNQINDRSFSEQLKKENPARFKPFHFYETRRKFMKNPYRDAPGYSQLERALAVAGFSSARQQLGGGSMERRCGPRTNTSSTLLKKQLWLLKAQPDYLVLCAAE
jgi:hypothetical protein